MGWEDVGVGLPSGDATVAVSTSIDVLIEFACIEDSSGAPSFEGAGVSAGAVPSVKSVE